MSAEVQIQAVEIDTSQGPDGTAAQLWTALVPLFFVTTQQIAAAERPQFWSSMLNAIGGSVFADVGNEAGLALLTQLARNAESMHALLQAAEQQQLH